MVLGPEGGAVGAPQPSRRRHRRPLAGECGSQSLELVMSLPVVMLALLLLVQAGLLGADIVAAQGLARDAARTGAIGEGQDVADLAAQASGRREVEVELDPERAAAGEPVTAEVRLRSRAFANLGVDVWLPARATMRREAR